MDGWITFNKLKSFILITAGVGFSSSRILLISEKTRRPLRALEEIHFYGVIDQVGGQFADGEAKTLFKSQRPEDPGGVLDKAQIVQDADRLVLDIFLGRKKINEGAKSIRVQVDGEGIDGEIASE